VIEVGMVIGGRLRIDQVLGAGGMGVVAAATHLELGNRVAVKVLRDELAQSPTLVERFIREARAVVALRTEHVCRVLDVGRLESGAPYIMMELLDGTDLARAIAQRPLPVPIAVEYMVQACVALAEAHAAGVVHRDLKPANLFVTRRRDGGALVKVLDFGIAKALTAEAQLTHGSGMLGSPGFTSPEQLQSPRDVDHRTDIWALGVTLYQLVSGRHPFFAANAMEIALKVASERPAPLDVDPQLSAVIFRCLEKDRERRYPDVRALVADLARFGGPGAVRAASELGQIGTPAPIAPSGPMIPPTAMTTATAHPPTARPQSVAPAAAPSRGWIWLALAVLVAGGAIVAAIVATHRPSTAAAPARDAVVARDAAPVADAPAPPPDAAVADAPPPDASPVDAGKQATIPNMADPKNFPHLDDMKKACRQAVGNPQMLAISPDYVVYCECVLGDAAKAKELSKKLTPEHMAKLVNGCKLFGVDL
jgi:serine/threonine-protein kinase